MACRHQILVLSTERDGCWWVKCGMRGCRTRGPKKHSKQMAVIAFGVSLSDQHPRRGKMRPPKIR